MSPVRSILVCALLVSTSPAQGLCSGSLSLGGNGEHVRVANHADLQNATAVTYDAWFFATRARGRIVSKGDGWGSASNRSFDMTYGSNSKVSAEFFFSVPTGRAYVPLNAATTSSLRTWTHVAATFDSAKSEVVLYVDGKVALKKTTPPGARLYQSTVPLTIGGTPPHAIWFAGQINQVRVWNVALSASQVAAFARVETHSLPGTKAAWSFDGHLFDPAGGHDGTAVGTIAWVGGCATWTNYHAGTAGRFGVPALTLDSNPVLGTTVNLVTDNASLAAAAGIIAVGTRPLSVPLLGGTLLAEPTFVFSVPIAASGAKLPLAIPNDVKLLGLPAFAQIAVSYPQVAQVAFSRGLQLMIGR